MKIEGLYTGTILKCTHINDTLKDDIDELMDFLDIIMKCIKKMYF